MHSHNHNLRNPKALACDKTSLVTIFVRGSAIISCVDIYFIATYFFITKLWKIIISFYTFRIAIIFRIFGICNCNLTIRMYNNWLIFINFQINYSRKILSQIASWTATEHAINSASMLDKAIHVFFLLLQEIATRLRRKHSPRLTSVQKSPPQSTSLHPNRCISPP